MGVLIAVVGWVIGVALMIGVEILAMWLMQSIADLTLPEFPTWLKQVSLMVLGYSVLNLIPWVGWIFGLILYFKLLEHWFDADWIAKIILLVTTWLIGLAVGHGLLFALEQI